MPRPKAFVMLGCATSWIVAGSPSRRSPIGCGFVPGVWLWLHIDLDVVDGNQLSACGAADDPAMPGLSWSELGERLDEP
jgi:hypothetical protein